MWCVFFMNANYHYQYQRYSIRVSSSARKYRSQLTVPAPVFISSLMPVVLCRIIAGDTSQQSLEQRSNFAKKKWQHCWKLETDCFRISDLEQRAEECRLYLYIETFRIAFSNSCIISIYYIATSFGYYNIIGKILRYIISNKKILSSVLQHPVKGNLVSIFATIKTVRLSYITMIIIIPFW